LKDVFSCFKEKAFKHGKALRADIPDDTGNLIADEMKIKQVVFNLLGNAIKFTPDGGSVRLTARKVTQPLIKISSKSP